MVLGLGHNTTHEETAAATGNTKLNNATNNYMNPTDEAGLTHGVRTQAAAPISHNHTSGIVPTTIVQDAMPTQLGTHGHNTGVVAAERGLGHKHDHTHAGHHDHTHAGHHAHGQTGATHTHTALGHNTTTVDSTFNPDPSLRSNNFNVNADYNRLQNSGLGGMTAATGDATHGHSHGHGHDHGLNHGTTGLAGVTGAHGAHGTHGTHGTHTGLDSRDNFTRDANVAGTTGVAAGGIGAASTGSHAGLGHNNNAHGGLGSDGVTASTNAKGQHSTLHGTTEKLTGTIQATIGKVAKKPALAEAGIEKKLAGQEEVALAKEEKAMKKN